MKKSHLKTGNSDHVSNLFLFPEFKFLKEEYYCSSYTYLYYNMSAA